MENQAKDIAEYISNGWSVSDLHVLEVSGFYELHGREMSVKSIRSKHIDCKYGWMWPFESEEEYLVSFLWSKDWWAEKESVYHNTRREVLKSIETNELSKMLWDKRRSWEEWSELVKLFEKEINARSSYGTTLERVDLGKLKSEVDILDVVQHYVWDIRYRPWSLIRCPLPDHNDGTASMSVKSDKWYFKCFWCGKWWSAIDFIMLMDGCSIKDAINKLKSFV
jgi:hypothetical protein